MYFIDAIGYPFKSTNWLKNVLIGLVLIMIPILNIIGSIILLGYGLRIIRRLAIDDMELPEFDDYTADLSRGFYVFMSTFLHGLPAVLFVMTTLIALEENAGVAQLSMFMVSIVLAIVLMIMAWVGIVRYAVSDDSRLLFRVQENFNFAISNFGATGKLVLNSFLFGLISGVIIAFGYLLFFIPGMIAAVAFQYGQFYLIARWGDDLGILDTRKRKPKNDDYLHMTS